MSMAIYSGAIYIYKELAVPALIGFPFNIIIIASIVLGPDLIKLYCPSVS